MKVPVIGMPECGRAVFLALLYETLIRISTAEGDDIPEVIVNTGPLETKVLGDLRLDLLSGRWPSVERKQKASGCVLDLGFRGRSASFFGRRELRKVRLENVLPSDKDLKVLRGSGQLREVREGSAGGSVDRHGLSELFRDALEGDAIVLLADVSEGGQERQWPREERDAFLATVVDNAARDRLGRTRRVSFMVVMTKAERAEADGPKVIETAYPRTAKALLSAVQKGSESHVVVSWVGTVPDVDEDQAPS
ncbi:MAG TPA: hypothetical protein PKJ15_06310, partial [Methanomassiliicoccales archaeon]|nr:hypothetical protein [Methanomassiliicoccales archaeon]